MRFEPVAASQEPPEEELASVRSQSLEMAAGDSKRYDAGSLGHGLCYAQAVAEGIGGRNREAKNEQ